MNIIRKICYSLTYVTIVNRFVPLQLLPALLGKESLAVLPVCACCLDLDWAGLEKKKTWKQERQATPTGPTALDAPIPMAWLSCFPKGLLRSSPLHSPHFPFTLR